MGRAFKLVLPAAAAGGDGDEAAAGSSTRFVSDDCFFSGLEVGKASFIEYSPHPKILEMIDSASRKQGTRGDPSGPNKRTRTASSVPSLPITGNIIIGELASVFCLTLFLLADVLTFIFILL